MTNQNNEKSKNGKRIALILLALLLIAAIAFGAYTYSKYVSSGNGSGSATVAKWGFTITASSKVDSNDNNVFGQYYNTSGTEQDSSNSAVIASASNKDVVAPGAKGSFRFSVTGDAEVQAELSTALSITNDIFITLQDADNTSTEIEYHPVLFTLKSGESFESMSEISDCVNVPLAVIAKYIDEDTSNLNQASIAPNSSKLSLYYELSWSWAFEVASDATLYTNNDGVLTAYNNAKFGKEAINTLDTVLGQLSNRTSFTTDITVSDNTQPTANVWKVVTTTSEEQSNYSTDISFALKISVSQSGITQG